MTDEERKLQKSLDVLRAERAALATNDMADPEELDELDEDIAHKEQTLATLTAELDARARAGRQSRGPAPAEAAGAAGGDDW